MLETTEVATWTGDDFPKSPKSGKSSRRKGNSASRAKRIAELPASVRSKHWAKYLITKPAHVKNRVISEKRADKLIGHIYKKKLALPLQTIKIKSRNRCAKQCIIIFQSKIR